MRGYIRILFFSFFLTSCSFQDLTVGNVESTKVKSLSKDGIDLELGIRIKNPNRIALKVYPSDFDASVNGIDVGKVKLIKTVRIKGSSDEISQFYVKSDFSKIGFADLPRILSLVAAKNISLDLKGDLKGGKWFFKKKFPVELKKNLSLSQ